MSSTFWPQGSSSNSQNWWQAPYLLSHLTDPGGVLWGLRSLCSSWWSGTAHIMGGQKQCGAVDRKGPEQDGASWVHPPWPKSTKWMGGSVRPERPGETSLSRSYRQALRACCTDEVPPDAAKLTTKIGHNSLKRKA